MLDTDNVQASQEHFYEKDVNDDEDEEEVDPDFLEQIDDEAEVGGVEDDLEDFEDFGKKKRKK